MRQTAGAGFWRVVTFVAMLVLYTGQAAVGLAADAPVLEVFNGGEPFAERVDPGTVAFVNRYLAFAQRVDPLRTRIVGIHAELDATFREIAPLLDEEIALIPAGDSTLAIAARAEKEFRVMLNRLRAAEDHLVTSRASLEPEINTLFAEYASHPEKLTSQKAETIVRYALLNEQLDSLRQVKELTVAQRRSAADAILQREVTESDDASYRRWSTLTKKVKAARALLIEVAEVRKTMDPERAAFTAYPQEHAKARIEAIARKKRLIEAAIPATAARIEDLERRQDVNSKGHAVLLSEIRRILQSDLTAANAEIGMLRGDLVLEKPTFLHVPSLPNADIGAQRIAAEQARIATALMDSADTIASLAQEIRSLDINRAALSAQENGVFDAIAASLGQEPETGSFNALSDMTKAQIGSARKEVEEAFKREEEIIRALQSRNVKGQARTRDLQVAALYAQLGVNHEQLAKGLRSLRDGYVLLDTARGTLLGVAAFSQAGILDDANFLTLNTARVQVDNSINELLGKWGAIVEGESAHFADLKRNGIRLTTKVKGELDAALAALPTTLIEAGDKTFAPFGEYLGSSLRHSAQLYSNSPTADQVGTDTEQTPWAKAMVTGEGYPFLLERAGGFAAEFRRLTQLLFSAKTVLLEKRLAVIEIARLMKLPSRLYFYEDSFTAIFGITRGGVIMRGIGDPARHRAAMSPENRHAQVRDDFILNPSGITGWLGDATRTIPGDTADLYERTAAPTGKKLQEGAPTGNDGAAGRGDAGDDQAGGGESAPSGGADGKGGRGGLPGTLTPRGATQGLLFQSTGTIAAQSTPQTIDFIDEQPNEPESLGVIGIIGDTFVGDGNPNNGFDWNYGKIISYTIGIVACAATGIGCVGLAVMAVSDLIEAFIHVEIDIANENGWISDDWRRQLDLVTQWMGSAAELIYAISQLPKMITGLLTSWKDIVAVIKELKDLTALEVLKDLITIVKYGWSLALLPKKMWDYLFGAYKIQKWSFNQMFVIDIKIQVTAGLKVKRAGMKREPYRIIPPHTILPAY